VARKFSSGIRGDELGLGGGTHYPHNRIFLRDIRLHFISVRQADLLLHAVRLRFDATRARLLAVAVVMN
jgi:hypothetical protein